MKMTAEQKKIIDRLNKMGTETFTNEEAIVLGFNSREDALEEFDNYAAYGIRHESVHVYSFGSDQGYPE